MPDFSSALYLGMRHPRAALAAWGALTTGKPAVLQEPAGSALLASRLARLTGCEAALLAPSTLHVFWDLIPALAGADTLILLDGASYPVARWGVERSAALGVRTAVFPAHAPDALARLLRGARGRPLIVSDGYSPALGAPPLAAYAALARAHGGRLVIDDTQGLGIFGRPDARRGPYGLGGGGALRRHRIGGPHVVYVASLAKAFGAPLAMLGADRATLARYAERSVTRVHCSPVDAAAVAAGLHALRLNAVCGDRLRRRLWHLTAQLRAALARRGIAPSGGAFPVQSVPLPDGADAGGVQQRLARMGVEAVLQRRRGGPALTLLVTARHTPPQIEDAAATVASCLQRARSERRPAARARWRNRSSHGQANPNRHAA